MATRLAEIVNTEWRRITFAGDAGTCWKKTGGTVIVCSTDQEGSPTLPLSNVNVTTGKSKRVPLDEDSREVLSLNPLKPNDAFYALSIDDPAQIVVDIGGYGPELFTTNPGFEIGGTGGDFNGGAEADDGTSDNFTDWHESGVNDGNGDKIEATTTKHDGAYAVKITRAVAAALSINSPSGGVTVTPETQFRLSFYTRGDGATAGHYYIYDRTNGAIIGTSESTGITGVVYKEFVKFFTTPAGCIAVDISLRNQTIGVVYFDAVSIKAVL